MEKVAPPNPTARAVVPAPFTEVVRSLDPSVPFVGPETIERRRGKVFRARLGANESPFGPSPLAIEAMRATLRESWMYGDPENEDLREALADRHQLPPETIIIGEGIDALLGYVVRLFVEPRTTVVTGAGSYPTFAYHVRACGGQLIEVPYADDAVDTDALAAAASESSARLVYIANPDNPTGSWRERPYLEAMIDKLPDGCLLLLDEAYADFAPTGVIPEMRTGDPRVLRFRTFSKAHGLAGLRIGYAIGTADLIAGFNKLRNHFGVNRLAQAAALAALDDVEHLQHTVRRVASARQRITEIALENDLVPLPSATNFVTIDCGADGVFARHVLEAFEAADIFIRMPGVAPLNRCIRIAASHPQDLDYLGEVFPDVLARATTELSARA